jgi:hypothetical protein
MSKINDDSNSTKGIFYEWKSNLKINLKSKIIIGIEFGFQKLHKIFFNIALVLSESVISRLNLI